MREEEEGILRFFSREGIWKVDLGRSGGVGRVEGRLV